MAKGTYSPGDFDIAVRRSFAGLGLVCGATTIPKGACVLEYTGRVLSPEEEITSRSKYLFAVSESKTIDGSARENRARYINHSCRPNCEAVTYRGRVFIMAKRAIKPGEELTYDYGREYFERHIEPKGCRCPKCAEPQSPAADGGMKP
jgi:SET domain-containing protein